MAKTEKPESFGPASSAQAASPKAQQVTAPPAERISIDEFCAQLSTGDKRVELIGAFHAAEKRAGRTSDTEAAFRARYQAFINKPV